MRYYLLNDINITDNSEYRIDLTNISRYILIFHFISIKIYRICQYLKISKLIINYLQQSLCHGSWHHHILSAFTTPQA